MAAFRLTARAAADLDAIADYTLATWGAERMEDYLRSLDMRFAWLSENPYLGPERPDILAGCRGYPHRSHLIVYRVRTPAIEILAVPHRSMDLPSHLRGGDT